MNERRPDTSRFRAQERGKAGGAEPNQPKEMPGTLGWLGEQRAG